MNHHIISLTEGIARNPQLRLEEAATFVLNSDEHIAIVGPNGSGKGLLTDIVLGRQPLVKGTLQFDFSPSASNLAYENVRYLEFRDTYGSADSNYYYQQRWHSMDQENIPTMREHLYSQGNKSMTDELIQLFELEQALDKKIILLSSGELRKMQLIKALQTSPRVLVLDNPFIGLDAASRSMLLDVLERLTKKEDIRLIVILSMLDDIPSFITHVVCVNDKICQRKITREEYLKQMQIQYDETGLAALREQITNSSQSSVNEPLPEGAEIVRLNRVSIRYGERTILKELDWVIHQGEKWALCGQNGSGKSTLLSLICADNPQSYACDIHLFGRKRGSGESIWDIKKRIGYVSPELHRAFRENRSTRDIVASGLQQHGSIYGQMKEKRDDVCDYWMKIFGIDSLKERSFLQLSSGQQRLALLARAFVKDPDLIILDEPLHGLDTYNRRRVKTIIDSFCRRPGKTLIMVTHYEEELPSCITNRLVLKKEA